MEEVRRRIHCGIDTADLPGIADRPPTQHRLAVNTRRSDGSRIRLCLTGHGGLATRLSSFVHHHTDDRPHPPACSGPFQLVTAARPAGHCR
ncbi:hypothetical protein Athai_14660 [Actinocatenispora thailandica]|uniref:Uncharacterized protein n=1 Tax=Actinocatenispora thailandica TaxID=227318 RepID=A0A7R7HVM6_9ACTN|nr:hypothetical protein [Actinocatenispora thailandica]BCJ33963.1 hypothetical protein Athai_14660 [Actinocatenispora thailandica]